jgi:mono/diheme cytochrome c family protein
MEVLHMATRHSASLIKILVAGAMLLVAGAQSYHVLAASPGELTSSKTKLGEYEYKTYCASCHGVSGKGDGALAKMLNTAPSDLTLIAKRHNGEFQREMVANVIDGRIYIMLHGQRDMPVWGDWFNREVSYEKLFGFKVNNLVVAARVDALVAYVQGLQQK